MPLGPQPLLCEPTPLHPTPPQRCPPRAPGLLILTSAGPAWCRWPRPHPFSSPSSFLFGLTSFLAGRFLNRLRWKGGAFKLWDAGSGPLSAVPLGKSLVSLSLCNHSYYKFLVTWEISLNIQKFAPPTAFQVKTRVPSERGRNGPSPALLIAHTVPGTAQLLLARASHLQKQSSITWADGREPAPPPPPCHPALRQDAPLAPRIFPLPIGEIACL